MSLPTAKIYRHGFHCKDCKMNFEIESEQRNPATLNKELTRGIRCPKCDKLWRADGSRIVNQASMAQRKIKTIEERRKDNVKRSEQAIQQAAIHREAHKGEDEMVNLQRPAGMGAPTKFGRATESVPKSVVDSLEDRAAPNEAPEE
jgi:uncharacterized C2H2 Zn-finger protein